MQLEQARGAEGMAEVYLRLKFPPSYEVTDPLDLFPTKLPLTGPTGPLQPRWGWSRPGGRGDGTGLAEAEMATFLKLRTRRLGFCSLCMHKSYPEPELEPKPEPKPEPELELDL